MIDVLIVGAGPTGLACAAYLAQSGRSFRLADRQDAPSQESRAAVVHSHTLEVLEAIGVTHSLVEVGIPAHRFTVRDRDRVLVPIDFTALPTEYPYSLMISQHVTESVLTERLNALQVPIERSVAVTSVRENGDHVVAELSNHETVQARYVVGADGMNSTVRSLAGIEFVGDDVAESFTLADVSIDGPLPRDEVVLFFSRAGMVVAAPLPGGRFRIVAAVDEAPKVPDARFVQSLLDARGPKHPVRVTDVQWGSRFRIHHKVAATYRRGRILLAGDSAHVHSPAGGQGMNLGLHDALALADAVGRVLDGGSDALLDDYSAARRPLAQEIVSFSKVLTRLATVPPAARPVRNLALGALGRVPRVRRSLATRLSGLVYRQP